MGVVQVGVVLEPISIIIVIVVCAAGPGDVRSRGRKGLHLEEHGGAWRNLPLLQHRAHPQDHRQPQKGKR